MRIEEIILREVGPFEDVRVTFKPGTNPELADVYLLTGPNGCGKSTILYAIASAIARGQPTLSGSDNRQIARRFHSASSLAAVQLNGDGATIVAPLNVDGIPRHFIANPFVGVEQTLRIQQNSSSIGYYNSLSPSPSPPLLDPKTLALQYWQRASRYSASDQAASHSQFRWAAFAYAGMRSLHEIHVSTVKEPSESPFLNSLAFLAPNTQGFAEWVVNQEFRRLKAGAANQPDRAERIASSVRHIETVISEVIGEAFSFETSDVDNNVRVKLGATILDFAVLPDGLKAIMNWLSDLLMRLDRIPWVDDTPVLQRSFLLLLDEVEVHLHPAWQRKVLPIVQRTFPKAQIIASTHSPFVVGSADDAQIIAFSVDNGVSTLREQYDTRLGYSYRAILRDVFGITSEFDTTTDAELTQFHELKKKVLGGDAGSELKLTEVMTTLAERSEELREIMAHEKRQLERQRDLASSVQQIP